MARAMSDYGRSVFVNCPFDGGYTPLFEAIIFTVFNCGFRARCALEVDDSGQIRIEKIFGIISECRLGIHDLSRTELDAKTLLPRFNMPLELGIFLGAKRYGATRQKHKISLILDTQQYRYQTFISDIAGQDIRAHAGKPEEAISLVRNWLRSSSQRSNIPGGKVIGRRYERFRRQLRPLRKRLRLSEDDELTFNDYTTLVAEWLKENS
jgi:hypothetical protein